MAGMLNNMANLANVKLTAALAATDTSVTVDDASPFQNLGDFYATLMPAGEMSRLSNSEIVLCSYATATTLAISRAQRGTTAKAFNAGDILTNGIYVEDLAQAQSVGNTIFDTMSSNNVYTLMSPSGNDMLPAIPTDGMKITIKVNYDSVDTPTIKTSSSATAFSVYTGSNVSGDDTLDPAVLLAGNIYELVFNGTAWIVLNQIPKVTSDNIDWTTLGVLGDYKLQEMATPFKDWDGDTVYRCVVDCGALPNASFIYVDIARLNVKRVLRLSGISYSPTSHTYLSLPMANPNPDYAVSLAVSPGQGGSPSSIAIGTGNNRTAYTQTYVEVVYTKN